MQVFLGLIIPKSITHDLDSSISTILLNDPLLKSLRWFLLPSEAKALMLTNLHLGSKCVKSPIFTPMSYGPVLLTYEMICFNTDICSMFPPSVNIGK